MQNNPMIFKRLDQRYQFNAIVISYWDDTPWGYTLLAYLVNNSNFTLVHLDPYVIVLVRNIPANKAVVSRYQVTKKNIKLTSQNSSELVHYLFFFEKVGWKDNVKESLTLLRENDPELCMLTKYPIEKTSINVYISHHNLAMDCNL
jgi:hypothetical protein